LELGVIIALSIGGLSTLVLALLLFAKLVSRRIRRKDSDKPPAELHKFRLKPPTWRFQKFHPSKCQHLNGIYREVEMKQLSETVKKKVFVCSDCIDVVEIEDINAS
jgi:hypothetical protein